MCGAQKSPTVKGGGRGGGSFSSLFPCISLRLQPETRHITQLTPCCPPHAQSGLISLHANRSLVTTETTQTTAGAKGCPLCLHGWTPKTNEEARGGFRPSGREKIKWKGRAGGVQKIRVSQLVIEEASRLKTYIMHQKKNEKKRGCLCSPRSEEEENKMTAVIPLSFLGQ